MKNWVLFSSLLFVTSPLLADQITLTSDLWCPYACEANAKDPGFMVEIAKEIFESEGHTVKYSVINWARAVSETRDGKYSGIVGASRADVAGFVIPTEPSGYSSNYFWTRKDSAWTYKDVNSLKGKKVAVINTYTYGDEVDNEVQKKNPSYEIVSGNDALPKSLKMLEAHRIESFVENPYVLSYVLRDLPEYKDHFKTVSKNIANDPNLFIVFSPKNPKSKKYAELISSGMAKLRKSGKLKAILTKYGLKDWK
jgi:polar amino acid transport system substrate-binding protein